MMNTRAVRVKQSVGIFREAIARYKRTAGSKPAARGAAVFTGAGTYICLDASKNVATLHGSVTCWYSLKRSVRVM